VQRDWRDLRETLSVLRDLSRSIDRDGVCSGVLPLQISRSLFQNRKWPIEIDVRRVRSIEIADVDQRAIGRGRRSL
jgi:hypothetical protein